MNMVKFGDCREIMRKWKQEGVKAQMCVTSPPYYGLRDYGHEGQLGLEQTPEEYIEAMVEVFRCVRDVLADDGVLWLNIGDSYCGTGDKGSYTDPKYSDGRNGQAVSTTKKLAGYKQKDLIGIPWMLAFALRADGWFLRQDIVWSKPNAMPESVRDRCTKAHEYIFLLTKSARYYYDHEAIKEPCSDSNIKDFLKRKKLNNKGKGNGTYEEARPDLCRGRNEYMPDNFMRNRRSVWTVNTKPYKGAHFATFPPSLIEPCILAGSRRNDIVLDPFMGSGTTAMVALQHGRQYMGCELNNSYEDLQKERIKSAFIPQKIPKKVMNDSRQIAFDFC